MSDRYFVDTNILMYAHDTTAGENHARAKALVENLWESRSGVVSTQVLQEHASLTRCLMSGAFDQYLSGSMWPNS
jgi:predicted nucleic acid-binding protein